MTPEVRRIVWQQRQGCRQAHACRHVVCACTERHSPSVLISLLIRVQERTSMFLSETLLQFCFLLAPVKIHDSAVSIFPSCLVPGDMSEVLKVFSSYFSLFQPQSHLLGQVEYFRLSSSFSWLLYSNIWSDSLHKSSRAVALFLIPSVELVRHRAPSPESLICCLWVRCFRDSFFVFIPHETPCPSELTHSGTYL